MIAAELTTPLGKVCGNSWPAVCIQDGFAVATDGAMIAIVPQTIAAKTCYVEGKHVARSARCRIYSPGAGAMIPPPRGTAVRASAKGKAPKWRKALHRYKNPIVVKLDLHRLNLLAEALGVSKSEVTLIVENEREVSSAIGVPGKGGAVGYLMPRVLNGREYEQFRAAVEKMRG